MKCEYVVCVDLVVGGKCKQGVQLTKTSQIGYNPPDGHTIWISDADQTVLHTDWDDKLQQIEIQLNGSEFEDEETYNEDIKALESFGWEVRPS